MLSEPLNQGQILVGGRNIHRLPANKIPYYRRRIGVVFQDHQLLFDRSVYDNVALPLQIDGYDKHEAARRVRAALDKVGLLSKEKLNPMTLSGGEQQRIGIARAVVNRPQILLADEPTGNLDTQTAAEVFELFRKVHRDRGCAVLLVTHDPRLSATCDRTINLVDGRIVCDTVNEPG